MLTCRNCGTVLQDVHKFCHNCGNVIKATCSSCNTELKLDYRFCPSCGKRRAVEQTASLPPVTGLGNCEDVQERPSSRQDLMTDVKEKLIKLREKKSLPAVTDRTYRPPCKKVRRELVINVGIKEIGTLKLQKKIGAIRKLYIDRDSTYVTCVQAICNAYKIKKHESMFLVDNENHNIVAEEFTVEHYVQNYSYKGATRLYLVVDLDILCFSNEDDPLPPSLTPQKGNQNVQKQTVVSQGPAENQTTDACKEEPESNEIKFEIFPSSVTLADVEDYISKEKQEKDFDEYVPDRNLVKAGHTPVYYKNVSVRYFVDKKKEEGEDIEIVDSAWGPFAQMPDEVFGEYLELRNTLDVSNMLYLSIPLFYFLKQTELNPINLCVVSRSVVTLESKVCEEFKAWYRGIKEKN